MFEELELKDGDQGIEELALNLRHAYNLPLPENVVIMDASDTEMNEVLEEAEVYQSDLETNEVEYAENDDGKPHHEQSELVQEQSMYADGDESVVYEFEEYAIESNVSQDDNEVSGPVEDEEADEISKHFM